VAKLPSRFLRAGQVTTKGPGRSRNRRDFPARSAVETLHHDFAGPHPGGSQPYILIRFFVWLTPRGWKAEAIKAPGVVLVPSWTKNEFGFIVEEASGNPIVRPRPFKASRGEGLPVPLIVEAFSRFFVSKGGGDFAGPERPRGYKQSDAPYRGGRNDHHKTHSSLWWAIKSNSHQPVKKRIIPGTFAEAKLPIQL